jgi:hypothetical protein
MKIQNYLLRKLTNLWLTNIMLSDVERYSHDNSSKIERWQPSFSLSLGNLWQHLFCHYADLLEITNKGFKFYSGLRNKRKFVVFFKYDFTFLDSTIISYNKCEKYTTTIFSAFIALLKRAGAASLTLILYLGSLKFIPIGIANALFNTMPIMTFFIEVFYFKKVPNSPTNYRQKCTLLISSSQLSVSLVFFLLSNHQYSLEG